MEILLTGRIFILSALFSLCLWSDPALGKPFNSWVNLKSGGPKAPLSIQEKGIKKTIQLPYSDSLIIPWQAPKQAVYHWRSGPQRGSFALLLPDPRNKKAWRVTWSRVPQASYYTVIMKTPGLKPKVTKTRDLMVNLDPTLQPTQIEVYPLDPGQNHSFNQGLSIHHRPYQPKVVAKKQPKVINKVKKRAAQPKIKKGAKTPQPTFWDFNTFYHQQQFRLATPSFPLNSTNPTYGFSTNFSFYLFESWNVSGEFSGQYIYHPNPSPKAHSQDLIIDEMNQRMAIEIGRNLLKRKNQELIISLGASSLDLSIIPLEFMEGAYGSPLKNSQEGTFLPGLGAKYRHLTALGYLGGGASWFQHPSENTRVVEGWARMWWPITKPLSLNTKIYARQMSQDFCYTRTNDACLGTDVTVTDMGILVGTGFLIDQP